MLGVLQRSRAALHALLLEAACAHGACAASSSAFHSHAGEDGTRQPPQQRCLYAVLGLARGASRADVKRAFRQRAKQLHPDVVASRGPRPRGGGGAGGGAAAAADAFQSPVRGPGRVPRSARGGAARAPGGLRAPGGGRAPLRNSAPRPTPSLTPSPPQSQQTSPGARGRGFPAPGRGLRGPLRPRQVRLHARASGTLGARSAPVAQTQASSAEAGRRAAQPRRHWRSGGRSCQVLRGAQRLGARDASRFLGKHRRAAPPAARVRARRALRGASPCKPLRGLSVPALPYRPRRRQLYDASVDAGLPGALRSAAASRAADPGAGPPPASAAARTSTHTPGWRYGFDGWQPGMQSAPARRRDFGRGGVLDALHRYRDTLEADLHSALLHAFFGPRCVCVCA